jgi:hypothetical protein
MKNLDIIGGSSLSTQRGQFRHHLRAGRGTPEVIDHHLVIRLEAARDDTQGAAEFP